MKIDKILKIKENEINIELCLMTEGIALRTIKDLRKKIELINKQIDSTEKSIILWS